MSTDFKQFTAILQVTRDYGSLSENTRLLIRRRLATSLALEQKWFTVERLTSAAVSIYNMSYKPEAVPPFRVYSGQLVYRKTSYRVIVHRVEVH